MTDSRPGPALAGEKLGEHLCGLYAGVRQRAEIVTALGPLGAESTPGGVNRLDVMRDVNLRSGTFSRRRAKPYKDFNRRCNHSVV